MSKIGVNMNIFQVTGKYIDLINEYIVNHRSQVDVRDSSIQQDMISLFKRIADEQTTEPPIQLLSVIIERNLRQQRKAPKHFLDKLVNNLSNGDISDETIRELEIVVSALDTKHSESLAKIRE